MTALVLPPGAGRRFARITVKVDTGQSPDFIAIESVLPPRWDGSPPHVHRAYDEAFYVLAGPVRFILGGATHDGEAGAYVFVPRGAPHGFANPGTEPARVLITATPGALGLVEGIYDLLDDDGSFDPEPMRALYAQHHSDILAPDRPT